MKVREAARGWRALLPAAVLLAAGCSDKNENPLGASDDVQVDPGTVSQQSIATLGFVNDFVLNVDEMAAGDFTSVGGDFGLPAGARSESTQVVWSDSLGGIWLLEEAGMVSDSTGTAEYDIVAWFQFRDGSGAIQMDPDSTTSSLAMFVDFFMDVHAEDQGSTFDLVLDYVANLTVGGFPDGPYTLVGDGDMHVALGAEDASGQDATIALDMGWDADLTVPAGGCPSGTASVTVETWTFDAVYDGTDEYCWTLRDGADPVGNGCEDVSCAPPAS